MHRHQLKLAQQLTAEVVHSLPILADQQSDVLSKVKDLSSCKPSSLSTTASIPPETAAESSLAPTIHKVEEIPTHSSEDSNGNSSVDNSSCNIHSRYSLDSTHMSHAAFAFLDKLPDLTFLL